MGTARREGRALGAAPTMDQIVAEVANATRMPVDEIRGRRRTGSIVEARHIVMWLASELTALSWADIGSALGGRDHGTVIRGVDRMHRLARAEPAVHARITGLAARLRPVEEAVAGGLPASEPGSPAGGSPATSGGPSCAT